MPTPSFLHRAGSTTADAHGSLSRAGTRGGEDKAVVSPESSLAVITLGSPHTSPRSPHGSARSPKGLRASRNTADTSEPASHRDHRSGSKQHSQHQHSEAHHHSDEKKRPHTVGIKIEEENSDESNSLDSHRQRQEEQEELEALRREVWRKRKERVRRIYRFFITKLCFKRRQRMKTRKKNKWINLGDRFNRNHERQEKLHNFKKKMKDEWLDMKLSYRKRCWKSLSRFAAQSFQDLGTVLGDMFGWIDKKTGLPRKVVEDYEFQEKVHENYHGWVFRARTLHGESVAIKIRDKSRGNVLMMPFKRAIHVMHKVGATNKTQSRWRRLLVRLGLVATFEHPHLVKLYDIMECPEFYIEIMEFMQGPVLCEFLESESNIQLDEIAACKIFMQIMHALQFLHHRRIVFRDLRLSNLMMIKDTNSARLVEVKLTDYWCVTRLPKHKHHIFDREFPGDIAIMSPEVIQLGEWTEKADVWAAGCLLFELLYGHPPYGGEGQALASRICKKDPEYDNLTGALSESAGELLRKMLHRRHHNRPSIKEALHMRWFHEFGTIDKIEHDAHKSHRINKVRIEKAPMFRRGMPPENLLIARTGMFNAGFCSFMGATSVAIDFEIGGPEEWKEFWVTSIRASLWGNGDNPKKMTALMAMREGGVYFELGRVDINYITDTEVEYKPNRPVRHLRLAFKDNFEGQFGIALRKIGFFGYEMRPVQVIIDYDKVIHSGTEEFVHSEEITDHMVNHRVHSTLQDALEKGPRIPGTGNRFWKYRDVYTGGEFRSTTFAIMIAPEYGRVLCAATLALRYLSYHPPLTSAPKIRITIEHHNRTIVLFKTPDLPCTRWNYKSLLVHGYDEMEEPMYNPDILVPTDEPILIEVHIENNSGYLYLPADFGLTFYYAPDLPSPDSENSEFEEKADLLQRRGRRQGVDMTKDQNPEELEKMMESKKQEEKKEEEIIIKDNESDHYESELSEAGLKTDLKDLEYNVEYGTWGASKFLTKECPALEIWEDMREDPTDDYDPHKVPWWERGWPGDDDGFSLTTSISAVSKVSHGSAMNTTCPPTNASALHTLSAHPRTPDESRATTPIYPASPDQSRQPSRDRDDQSPAASNKLDAWGALDEWEHRDEWRKGEHDGPTDAWGVPLDVNDEQDRLEREEADRANAVRLARDQLTQITTTHHMHAVAAFQKFRNTPAGLKLHKTRIFSEEKARALENSVMGMCMRMCEEE